MRSRHVKVSINLERVRAAAEAIRQRTGVPLIAVIKANAYGLGAVRVADALAAVADEFAYFTIDEARKVGRPGIVLGPPEGDPGDYAALGLRPAVASRAAAERFRRLPVALNVDTGMQRFGCAPEELDEILSCCQAEDIFTHAATLPATLQLQALCRGRSQRRHAACSALLDEPQAWLDAVRPGLALYRDAVRVTTRLHTVRQTTGRIGYTGFTSPRIGVILAGYSQHLRSGPVLINGRRQHLLEIGMDTSFVSVEPDDRAGDEVLLLGDALSAAELAAHFDCREHEILCRYTSMGPRSYGRAPKATYKCAAEVEQSVVS